MLKGLKLLLNPWISHEYIYKKQKQHFKTKPYHHIVYLLIILLNYNLDKTFMNISIDASLGLLIGIKVKN